MIEEYLNENYNNYKELLDKETRKMKEGKELESIIRREINEIQKNSDIDFEIFSPRMGNDSLKGKIKQFYEELDKVKIENVKMKVKVDQYKEEVSKYSLMIEEFESMKKN